MCLWNLFYAVCLASHLQGELFSHLSNPSIPPSHPFPPPRISFVLQGEGVGTLLGWVEEEVTLTLLPVSARRQRR